MLRVAGGVLRVSSFSGSVITECLSFNPQHETRNV
jgi:hypothetical protein